MKPVALCAALVVLFTLAFVTVRHHAQAFSLGYSIGKLHKEARALRANIAVLRFRLEREKCPARLIKKISRMNLELEWNKERLEAPEVPNRVPRFREGIHAGGTPYPGNLQSSLQARGSARIPQPGRRFRRS